MVRRLVVQGKGSRHFCFSKCGILSGLFWSWPSFILERATSFLPSANTCGAFINGNCGYWEGEKEGEESSCAERPGRPVRQQVPHSPVGPVPGPALATQAAVASVHHVGQSRSPRAALDGSCQLQQASLWPSGTPRLRRGHTHCKTKKD